MIRYVAPLREFLFVLEEQLGIERLRGIGAFAAATPGTISAVLGEAARFCEGVLLPANRVGDQEACRFENGTVRTPAALRAAYRAFAEAGWLSLACDPAWGGQGQPEVLNFALGEMACATNLAFYTYAAISHAAYLLIEAHGSEEMRRVVLPRLVEGCWSATMCLTEAHCGTDIGLIETRARPAEDGSFRIAGTKSFVTGGEQDLTENIVHLVLARIARAPAGTQGLSLFMVPKFLFGPEGARGIGNRVVCGSLAAKMGLHASATCTMHFEEATGYLVGRPGRGLPAMLTMMNIARATVGLQGLGLAETAYQSARAYARERLQGRAIAEAGARERGRAADPIVLHPDIRRMLMTMKALIEGGRGVAYALGVDLDLARHHPDAEARKEAEDLAQIMTPVVKAFLTDSGFEIVNLGLQIFGGHGYLREVGMEQLVRDARVGQLYEGTNGVQALDLVSRKIVAGSGRLVGRFFARVARVIEEAGGEQRMQEFVQPLAAAASRLRRVTAWLAEGARSPADAAAGASEYLRLFGLVALAANWAKSATIALAALGTTEERAFYEGKIATARFFMRRLLPQSLSLTRSIMAGGDAVMAPEAAVF
ncbi:MAG: acyl-CoA dehydrogenase C-terminal domain-containing protein [Rhodospirillales bacterium]|nr:acyl-CoA dehydrogenase C-terminal domain-containing protein [Rhodospirillales bacterium]